MSTTRCCQPNEKTWEDKNRRLSVKQLLEKQDYLNSLLPFGKGWYSVISVNMLKTAIISELGEITNQEESPQWKWWKQKDPELYSEWMTKLEVVDIVHFYLSIAILEILGSIDHLDKCSTDKPFVEYDYMYVGTDKGNFFSGIGLVSPPNLLNHDNFVEISQGVLFTDLEFFGWVDTLDRLVSSIGMTSEEVSALYTAKYVLNSFRFENPDWEKVDAGGVEDNERLFPLVQAFLDDSEMTLDMLEQNVIDEFYEEPE